MKTLRLLIVIGIITVSALNLSAQDRIDGVSSRLIKEYTTQPEFLSPLVDHIPESANIPSPRDFHGYVIGAPKKLTHAADIHNYFYELAEKSNRIRVFETGKTNEGRSRILAVIADERTLRNIDNYKDYMKALADPRKTGEAEAKEIIGKAKTMYLITGGLHSTETGSPDMLQEMAYRLIVSDAPHIKAIRENIITLIIPVLEVDGREKQVDWYYRYTIDYDNWEDMPRTSPPYWGKYTFHDNNREGIQVSQPLTKQIYDVFFEYLPVLSLDLHESIPLLYISTGTGPYNPNIDPITITEFQLLSQFELAELTRYNMPGVWTWGFYTGWYPGYLLWITANHNTIGRFYETYGNAGANTFERKVQGNFTGKPITSKQWYRPIPPPKKVLWSFRNNINYMQSGVLSGMYFASQNSKKFLENFWIKSKNALEKGKSEKPFAWLITNDTGKKDMLIYMLSQLNRHGIEVHRLDHEITCEDISFPEGTYVVRLDQPYGPLAKNLLEIQKFPHDSEYRPYDDVAWTLGLQYGVKTVRVDEEFILNEPMSMIDFPYKEEIVSPHSAANYYIVPNSGSPSMISMRYELKNFQISAAEERFSVNGREYKPGTWIINGSNGSRSVLNLIKESAQKNCIDFNSTSTLPSVPMHELDLPKVAVYHNWVFTQDTGWFRFTMEQYGIEYTLINDDVLRSRNGLDGFDMVIIPELRAMAPKILVHGQSEKFGPIAYTKTEEFPSHGYIDQSEDITKGMGFDGLRHLGMFVDNGGLLVTLGGGSIIPVDLGLAPGVDRVNPATVRVVNPGSFVKTKVLNTGSPIAYGYDEETHIFTGTSPMFNVSFADRKYIVMQYGRSDATDDRDENSKIVSGEGSICISGMVKNQDQLIHKPAVLNIPRGSGRMVIFNFNPAHRYLNHHDFNLLFNTILNWNDLEDK